MFDGKLGLENHQTMTPCFLMNKYRVQVDGTNRKLTPGEAAFRDFGWKVPNVPNDPKVLAKAMGDESPFAMGSPSPRRTLKHHSGFAAKAAAFVAGAEIEEQVEPVETVEHSDFLASDHQVSSSYPDIEEVYSAVGRE